MAKDLSLPLRKSIVDLLQDSATRPVSLPAEQVCGMIAPAGTPWPFTRYGSPGIDPLRGQCMAGSVVDGTIHAFSKEPSEDECAEILAWLAETFDGEDGKGVTIVLDGGFKAHLQWRGNQIIPDAAEADAWHGLARFEASIVA